MRRHQLYKVPAATLTAAQYFLFPQYEEFAYLVTRVATVFKYRHRPSFVNPSRMLPYRVLRYPYGMLRYPYRVLFAIVNREQ